LYLSRIHVFLLGTISGAMLFAQNATQRPATPVSSEINVQLPAWLRFTGEDRARMDFIEGQGFKSVGDLYLLNRLRLNLDVRPSRWLKFSFQAEDARPFGQNAQPAPASQKESMDLRVGYVQFGGEEGTAILRAGRQPLDFGEGRLLSDPAWSNVGRTFDAARLTLRRGSAKVDLFTGSVVSVDPLSFDRSTFVGHLHGAYGSLGGLVPNATIEPYAFWRLDHSYRNENGALGNLDQKTIGLRWDGKLPRGLDYNSEIAGQTGSWAGDRIRAWMGHWVVGQRLPGARHRPRVFIELNRASGDAGLKDGRHGAFEVLFPGSHDKYGLTDLFCASNLIHFRPGVQYTVRTNLMLSAAYNEFWLASAGDALYVGGKAVARSLDGSAGTHIGHEGEVQAQWTVSAATAVVVGYGHLFPGEFLRKTTSGVPYQIVFASIAQRF
jgi:hypothetical protein